MGSTHIYGGLSHVELDGDTFELGHGISLRRTYAHLMSPNLMAFSPAPPGGHHPSPWRAAKGGLSYDIAVELCVPATTKLPGELNPDEMIWWIAALLRLVRYPFLLVPVVADQPFSEAAHSTDEPVLRLFETEPRLLKAAEPQGQKLDSIGLDWVKHNWKSGAHLMQHHPSVKRAFIAFDSCTVQGRTASSLLAVWSGLEHILSPSPGELRFRVSSYLAAYLEPPGPARLALYKKMLELYNIRSRAAHTADEIEVEALIESYVVMRNVLLKIIDTGCVPTQSDLESLLFCANE